MEGAVQGEPAPGEWEHLAPSLPSLPALGSGWGVLSLGLRSALGVSALQPALRVPSWGVSGRASRTDTHGRGASPSPAIPLGGEWGATRDVRQRPLQTSVGMF